MGSCKYFLGKYNFHKKNSTIYVSIDIDSSYTEQNNQEINILMLPFFPFLGLIKSTNVP